MDSKFKTCDRSGVKAPVANWFSRYNTPTSLLWFSSGKQSSDWVWLCWMYGSWMKLPSWVASFKITGSWVRITYWIIDSGKRFAIGIDSNTCVVQTFSLSLSSQAASIVHSPKVSKIRLPVCAPAFSIKICIKERSNRSSSISLEIACDAFSTVAKSNVLSKRVEVIPEVAWIGV